MIIFTLISFICLLWALAIYDRSSDSIFTVFMLTMFFLFFPFISMVNHFEDVGTIRANHYIVEVQEERISRLTTTLNAITNPVKDIKLSLNADSPIASIVNQLSEAEEALAQAKNERAKALVSVEQREAGFFWPIVWAYPVEEIK